MSTLPPPQHLNPPGKRPSAASDATEAIVRDHVAGFEESGLLTITGGKWTTHRLMAQDAVDLALGSGKSPLAVREGAAGNVEKGANRRALLVILFLFFILIHEPFYPDLSAIKDARTRMKRMFIIPKYRRIHAHLNTYFL